MEEERIIRQPDLERLQVKGTYGYLHAVYGELGQDWVRLGQFLLEGDDGVQYDLIDIRLASGEEHSLYFELPSSPFS